MDAKTMCFGAITYLFSDKENLVDAETLPAVRQECVSAPNHRSIYLLRYRACRAA